MHNMQKHVIKLRIKKDVNTNVMGEPTILLKNTNGENVILFPSPAEADVSNLCNILVSVDNLNVDNPYIHVEECQCTLCLLQIKNQCNT